MTIDPTVRIANALERIADAHEDKVIESGGVQPEEFDLGPINRFAENLREILDSGADNYQKSNSLRQLLGDMENVVSVLKNKVRQREHNAKRDT